MLVYNGCLRCDKTYVYVCVCVRVYNDVRPEPEVFKVRRVHGYIHIKGRSQGRSEARETYTHKYTHTHTHCIYMVNRDVVVVGAGVYIALGRNWQMARDDWRRPDAGPYCASERISAGTMGSRRIHYYNYYTYDGRN